MPATMNSRTRTAPHIAMVEISGRGGICHYTGSLLQSLAKLADIELFTGNPFELEGKVPGVRVHEVFRSYRTNPLRIVGMLWRLATSRPAAVHFQLSQAPWLVAAMVSTCRLLGLRVVVTAHNVLPHERSQAALLPLRVIYGLASAIIVHSGHCRGQLNDEFGAACAGRARIIDHGDYMLLAGPTKAAVPQDPVFTILFFGFIRKYKGLHILLQAATVLRAKGKQFRVLIVGRPVERFEPYQTLIDSGGISDCVSCVLDYVPLEDIAGYFQRSHCIALPYLDASQSGVLQLAYAFNRPVIASRVGGLPEAVEQGVSGLLVNPGDVEDLVTTLGRLIDDPALCRKLGEGARRLADTRFSWPAIAALTLESYQ